MRYAGSGDMANADAGHDSDELDRLLSRAEETGSKLHCASQRLHDAGYGLSYSPDRMGADSKLVVESYVDNQMAESDAFIDQMEKLIGDARAAQRLQTGTDDKVADALAGAVAKE